MKFQLIDTTNTTVKEHIGEFGTRVQGKVGKHAIITLDSDIVITTSLVQKIEKYGNFYHIKTKNSGYDFKLLKKKTLRTGCKKIKNKTYKLLKLYEQIEDAYRIACHECSKPFYVDQYSTARIENLYVQRERAERVENACFAILAVEE